MRFDSLSTMEGRHLAWAYAAVILIQGGYFASVLRSWLRTGTESQREQKKATKPAE